MRILTLLATRLRGGAQRSGRPRRARSGLVGESLEPRLLLAKAIAVSEAGIVEVSTFSGVKQDYIDARITLGPGSTQKFVHLTTSKARVVRIAVGMNAHGNFAVSWEGRDSAGRFRVYTSVFNRSGARIMDFGQVEPSNYLHQRDPSVDISDYGEVVVAYTSTVGSYSGVKATEYTSYVDGGGYQKFSYQIATGSRPSYDTHVQSYDLHQWAVSYTRATTAKNLDVMVYTLNSFNEMDPGTTRQVATTKAPEDQSRIEVFTNGYMKVSYRLGNKRLSQAIILPIAWPQ